jgi:Protein kinase domain
VSARGGRQLLLGVAALLVAEAWPSTATAHPGVPGSVARQGAQTVEIEVVGDVVVGRPTEIVFRATNPAGDANQGSITVSLPGNPNVEIVGASAPGPKLFQSGEPMYNFGVGRPEPIQVRAAELFVSSWPTGTRHELRLRLTSSVPYTIQARASFRRGNGTFVHLPANGLPDQQGAPTRVLDLTPRQVSPPTPKPVPPTTVLPTATRPPETPTAPPTRAADPTSEKPPPSSGQAGKPTAPPAAPTTAPPTSVVPPPPVPGPAGAPTVTPAPPPRTPSGSESSSQGGPSIPLLLAGFGIMAVGVAVGLIALALVLRRRSSPPPPQPAGWPGPGRPRPHPDFWPGGTARLPISPTGELPSPLYGGEAYPGAPPPWSPPSPGRGGPAPGWPPTPGTSDPSVAAVPPWERPTTPPPPRDPRGGQRHPEPPPYDFAPTHTDEPPTVGRPLTGGGRRDDVATPRPTSVEGLGGGAVTPQGDRYTDRVLVGRGGMGSVYRAYDSRLRRWVALKIMHADLGLRPGFLDRFIREAQMAAMLEHPNIVTVYDIEPVGDSIQMVMSWIDGRDLQQVLEREGVLAPERAAMLLGQMAAALDHAHLRDRPVLHRDIKPSNIMVGPSDRVILTDFGIARLMGDVSLTQTGQMVGTPAFMAPEVAQGEEPDARSDLYALGVVLFQMLTGRAPFQAPTPLALLHAHVHTPPPAPRTVVPSLPAGVDSVLARALAKDPNARFQTVGALAQAFRTSIGLL